MSPSAIVLSPTARTTETLERIGPGLPADATVWSDRRIYEASASTLLDVIRELPGEFSEAMLIGHNPGLGSLAVELAGSSPEAARMQAKYPTGALTSFSAGGSWNRVSPRNAKLELFLTPKELG